MPLSPAPELTQMEREHAAWRSLCQQLKLASASLDINEEDALHASILLWAETLSGLRATQTEDVCDRAYDEAVAKYNQHIGFLPYS